MYFRNVASKNYRFGNNEQPVSYQDLTAYVAVVDRLKHNLAFYNNYYILDGDRPDQLSFKLYGTSKYYWMFYLMNDHIRERGWPLSENRLVEKVKLDYPNTVLTTRDTLTGKFLPDSIVTGSGTGATGTVLNRNLDLGQIVVSTNDTFSNSEVITEGNNSAVLVGAVKEHLSIAYYKDASGRRVDIDPYGSPPSNYTPVTWEEEYRAQNTSLREIRIPRSEVVSDINNIFISEMRNG